MISNDLSNFRRRRPAVMFELVRVIVVLAILNVGYSTTTQPCSPDETVEFACQSPTCVNTLKDELSQGRLLTGLKSFVSVVGFNANSYLIKKKDKKLSIVPKNGLRLTNHPKNEHWKYKVNINTKTYKVCGRNNQNNEENYNGSKISQTKSNNNKAIGTPEVNESNTSSLEKHKNIGIVSTEDVKNNEDLVKREDKDGDESEDDEDIDDIEDDEDIDDIEDDEDVDENEDESNLDSSLDLDPSKINSDIPDTIVKKNLPAKSDEVLNADLVNQKTNSNAIDTSKIDEKANSSSVEKDEIIDSVSVEDVKDDEHKDLDKNSESNVYSSFALEKSKTNNIVKEFVSENSDRILDADLVNKRENSLNEKTNQNNSTEPTSAQKLESDSSVECTLGSCTEEKNRAKSFVNKESSANIASPVNEENSYQKKIDHSPTTKQNNTKKKQVDSGSLKNPSTADLEDENNGSNNIHQQKNDELAKSQQLPSVKQAESPTKDLIANIESQNTSIDELQDGVNDSERLNSNGIHQENKEVLTNSYQQSSLKKTEISTKEIISNNNPQHLYPNNIQNDKGSDKLNLDSSLKKQNVRLSKNEQPLSIETTDTNTYVGNLHKSNNNDMEEIYKTQQQGSGNTDSLLEKANVSNHQSPQLALLEKVTDKLNNENDSLPSNLIENSLLNDYNQSKINEFPKQSDSKKNIGANSFEELNDQSKLENQNISNENVHNVESTTLNNNAVDNNSTYSSPLQELTNVTGIVSSPNGQNPAGTEEIMVEKSIEPCLSENESCHLDKDPNLSDKSIQQNYVPENKDLPYYNNAHKYTKNDNDEKYKEFEPKSFVSSFGHPDTCSGIGCLNFNRNIEKTIKSTQTLNSISKQENPDAGSINTDFEKENKNIIRESSEKSDVKLSFLDSFLNWISSPTLNTIGLLKNALGEYSNEYNDIYSDQSANDKMIGNNKHINHSELYFIVVAIVTILFSLIYYKYQNGTNENNLLSLLAAKDEKLLIIEKELLLLKEQGFENTITTTARNNDYETLNEQMTKSEDIISSQAVQIEKLEQEVEELTESGMEMHALLSSALDSNAKNKDKLNTLKCKLTESENFVSALTQKNFEKTAELEKKNDLIKSLQITVDELTRKNMNLVEDNAKISLQLEQTISKNTFKETKLLSEINHLKLELDKQTNTLVTAENEVLLSRNALQEMSLQKFNPADAKKFVSSVKLSAELKSAKQMCEEYKHKLNESLKSNQQHLDHVDLLKSDIASLEDKFSKLQEEKEESSNKLNILTKFFKEQEKEYIKQINEKSKLCDTEKGESIDLNEHIKRLNQEISNYKSEIQSLKKEITDQEDSFKIQISAADKKASDYWISYRQAERKLKEMELETAQLRNKLTMVDKKMENGTKSIDSSKDFEDELLDIPLPTVSPDFTLLDFEPPPPILTNERLPPLGALGHASSPPVPLSRRHNRSLSPGSPPPLSQRSSVFRPLPQRYNRYINRQNSLGHSVESLDK